MTRVARAAEKREPQGFMNVLIDAQTKEGDEVIHSILDIMYAKARRSIP